MMPDPVEFRIGFTHATCAACGFMVAGAKGEDGRDVWELSPHLRDAHGFSDRLPKFETVGEVICPRMTIVRATDVASSKRNRRRKEST